MLAGHSHFVNSVAFRPDGKTVGSGSSDQTVRLWDVEQRREAAVLQGHTGGVKSVAFSTDGRVLASGSDDGTILIWGTASTAVDDRGIDVVSPTPTTYALFQNHRNPFNPQTTISYDLPKASDIRLSVYNLSGQEVRILVQGYHRVGHDTAGWEGTDEGGQEVASGVYFYRLIVDGGRWMSVRKMLLVR